MNNKTKFIVWLVVIILVVLVGYVFLGKNRTPVPKSFTIGASLPLTGKSASFGERVKNGMDLAVKNLEQKEDLVVRIVYEDDKGEAPTAVTVANKLINTDKVKVIIGSIKSDAVLAMAPITEKQKIIMFSPTAGADAISEAGDYVFRNIELAQAHGKGAVDFLRSVNKKNVALFTAQASNAKTYGDVFRKNLSGSGTIVFTLDYNQENTDFRTDITKALQTKPDAFYLAVATAKDAGILVKQIRDQGFTGIVVASIAAEAKEFFDTAGSKAEGVFVTSAAFNPDSSEAEEFTTQYRSEYKTDPDWVSANAYDAVILLAKSIKSCGGDQNTDCIRDFLYNTENYNGVGGSLSFDNNGDVVKPVIIKIAKDGKFLKY